MSKSGGCMAVLFLTGFFRSGEAFEICFHVGAPIFDLSIKTTELHLTR